MSSQAGFIPPAYPYDRLVSLRQLANRLPGGAIDCSIGTPCDPPPQAVLDALSQPQNVREYPLSVGSSSYRQAAKSWLQRCFDVQLPSDMGLAACIGTKEFVVSLPHYLKLRNPERCNVLYPAVSYPSYAMGAVLAGCRAVPVAVDERFRVDLSSISEADAQQALCLWVNTPGNPAGGLDNLAEVAEWARSQGVLAVSDECYAEFTWNGCPRTILEHGTSGVLAVHSLSKRSNVAGLRAGFYAGDADVVHYLSEVRKHAGVMVPGPVQAAAVAAWSDYEHVKTQRNVYRERLQILAEIVSLSMSDAETVNLSNAETVNLSNAETVNTELPELPDGGFYLWVPAPDGDANGYAKMLAAKAGIVVSLGEFYTASDCSSTTGSIRTVDDACDDVRDDVGDHAGDDARGDVGRTVDDVDANRAGFNPVDARGYVRIAAVQPSSRLHLALERLSG